MKFIRNIIRRIMGEIEDEIERETDNEILLSLRFGQKVRVVSGFYEGMQGTLKLISQSNAVVIHFDCENGGEIVRHFPISDIEVLGET